MPEFRIGTAGTDVAFAQEAMGAAKSLIAERVRVLMDGDDLNAHYLWTLESVLGQFHEPERQAQLIASLTLFATVAIAGRAMAEGNEEPTEMLDRIGRFLDDRPGTV